MNRFENKQENKMTPSPNLFKNTTLFIITAMVVVFFFITSCSLNEKKQSEDIKNPSSFWAHRYKEFTNISYGSDPEQRLDVLSQVNWVGEPKYWYLDSLQHPTLIFFHGGGWVGGNKESQTPWLIPYLERGFNVVNVEYRRGSNTAPQAIDDSMCAIAWVVENSEKYNINIDQVVISGGSAGGHLALITGLLNAETKNHQCNVGESIKIQAIVNWFGITDIAEIENYLRVFKPQWNYAGAWISDLGKVDSISTLYSPVNHVTPKAPPIVTIHGKLDSVVLYNQAVKLHKRLSEEGVKNLLVTDPYGKHNGFNEAQFQKSYTQIFSFLEDVAVLPTKGMNDKGYVLNFDSISSDISSKKDIKTMKK